MTAKGDAVCAASRTTASDGNTVVLADSVTDLQATAAGQVVVCGSHGGVFVGQVAARHAVAGIVLNDAGVGRDGAGVGRDGAGIAGLEVLDRCGIPAAAASCSTCRIGDAMDALSRGRISFTSGDGRHCRRALGRLAGSWYGSDARQQLARPRQHACAVVHADRREAQQARPHGDLKRIA